MILSYKILKFTTHEGKLKKTHKKNTKAKKLLIVNKKKPTNSKLTNTITLTV